MAENLKNFDPNGVGNPDNNIFGLPTTLEDSKLVIMPVPWEVTVSYNAGTARSSEHIKYASLQVDLFDRDYPDMWQEGYYLRNTDSKILTKSDYLRKEAELYINYVAQGSDIRDNKFMTKTLTDINKGSEFLNTWVYENAKTLLEEGKLVALLGGDHSTPFGFYKAIAEKYSDFGILQIDAHCDLRMAYEGFNYSHASIMYNSLEQIPEIKKLVQVGIRDYCDEEIDYIARSNGRVKPYFDSDIRDSIYEGKTWALWVEEIINDLPQHVYISFDIDGLKPNLCPNTGTPVFGGFEVNEIFYLFKKLEASGRKIIGFDLNEVGVSSTEWDANVAARVLYKMCNIFTYNNKRQLAGKN